ncbi:MAG TPA: hypothetical protein VLC91_03810 [Spongiibacteraceae bacterium]|nr:hypothetical protein [Spongiibacteraceae bacterium]
MKAIALALLLGLAPLCCAADHSQALAIAASNEVDALKSWQDLLLWYQTYPPRYDDGEVSEGISDFIGTTLAYQWQTLPELIELAHQHPSYLKFITQHLGEIIGCNETKIIIGKALQDCPMEGAAVCTTIRQNLSKSAAPECLPEP